MSIQIVVEVQCDGKMRQAPYRCSAKAVVPLKLVMMPGRMHLEADTLALPEGWSAEEKHWQDTGETNIEHFCPQHLHGHR